MISELQMKKNILRIFMVPVNSEILNTIWNANIKEYEWPKLGTLAVKIDAILVKHSDQIRIILI